MIYKTYRTLSNCLSVYVCPSSPVYLHWRRANDFWKLVFVFRWKFTMISGNWSWIMLGLVIIHLCLLMVRQARENLGPLLVTVQTEVNTCLLLAAPIANASIPNSLCLTVCSNVILLTCTVGLQHDGLIVALPGMIIWAELKVTTSHREGGYLELCA